MPMLEFLQKLRRSIERHLDRVPPKTQYYNETSDRWICEFVFRTRQRICFFEEF